VSFVATEGLVRRWDDFLADRAHLNDAGHERIAELLPTLPAGKRTATAR
jgi:lysophospholipase L1-like esterase